MDGTTDDRYFEWLYSQVGAVRNRNPERSFWDLLKQLYKKEYVWLIPNDDNRVEEGKALRYEFIEAMGIDEPLPSDWMELGCSMLEMLIALSRRASFETETQPAEWFWIMMHNADLRRYSDAAYCQKDVHDQVDDILDRIIYRNYNADGSGGLFPLSYASHDQRQVELWYQLNTYLSEMTEP